MAERPAALADLPEWPLLLDMPAVCRLTSLPRRSLERAIAAGRLPAAREFLPGVWRWHLDEVKIRLADLYGLEGHDRRAQASRQLAQDALDALAQIAAPAVRRGHQSPRQAVSVLSPGRDALTSHRPRRQRGIPL